MPNRAPHSKLYDLQSRPSESRKFPTATGPPQHLTSCDAGLDSSICRALKISFSIRAKAYGQFLLAAWCAVYDHVVRKWSRDVKYINTCWKDTYRKKAGALKQMDNVYRSRPRYDLLLRRRWAAGAATFGTEPRDRRNLRAQFLDIFLLRPRACS